MLVCLTIAKHALVEDVPECWPWIICKEYGLVSVSGLRQVAPAHFWTQNGLAVLRVRHCGCRFPSVVRRRVLVTLQSNEFSLWRALALGLSVSTVEPSPCVVAENLHHFVRRTLYSLAVQVAAATPLAGGHCPEPEVYVEQRLDASWFRPFAGGMGACASAAAFAFASHNVHRRGRRPGWSWL